MTDVRYGGLCGYCGQPVGLCRCYQTADKVTPLVGNSQTRAMRIRELAANRMIRWDYLGKGDPWITESAKRNLEEAALIIDTIDALPVPAKGER